MKDTNLFPRLLWGPWKKGRWLSPPQTVGGTMDGHPVQGCNRRDDAKAKARTNGIWERGYGKDNFPGFNFFNIIPNWYFPHV